MNSFKLNKARPKDKFPLPNIDLLIDPTKATTISTMKRHTTVKELKNFLERVSYIRKFTPRPALVTSGLSKLLKKRMFSYGELSNQMSFIKLQQIMSHLPTLWVLVHGKITIIVPKILIPSIQSIEGHQNEVSQHRKGVYGSHASQQLNH